MALFLAAGAWRRVNVYDAFIDGAKEGFGVAVQIIPYLIAMLTAISVFRTTGCMDYLMRGIEAGVVALGPTDTYQKVGDTALTRCYGGALVRWGRLATLGCMAASIRSRCPTEVAAATSPRNASTPMATTSPCISRTAPGARARGTRPCRPWHRTTGSRCWRAGVSWRCSITGMGRLSWVGPTGR